MEESSEGISKGLRRVPIGKMLFGEFWTTVAQRAYNSHRIKSANVKSRSPRPSFVENDREPPPAQPLSKYLISDKTASCKPQRDNWR